MTSIIEEPILDSTQDTTIIPIHAAYVGRMNPIHLGHQAVITEMLATYGDKSLIILGSANSSMTLRHFFSYQERSEMVRKLFPDVKLVGLADHKSDSDWFASLDDTLIAIFGTTDVMFYGGCEEDIQFFFNAGRSCKVINRFDGTTPKISATEVRDALIHARPLDGLVEPQLHDHLTQLFSEKWALFQKI